MLTLTIERPRDQWTHEHYVRSLNELESTERLIDVLTAVEPYQFTWKGDGFYTPVTYGACEYCEFLETPDHGIKALYFDIRGEDHRLVSYDDGEPWRGESYYVDSEAYPYWKTGCTLHAQEVYTSYFEWQNDI